MEVNLKHPKIPKGKRQDSGLFRGGRMEKSVWVWQGQMPFTLPARTRRQGCRCLGVSLFRPLLPTSIPSPCAPLFRQPDTPSLSKHLLPGPSLCRRLVSFTPRGCSRCGVLAQLQACPVPPPRVFASPALPPPGFKKASSLTLPRGGDGESMNVCVLQGKVAASSSSPCMQLSPQLLSLPLQHPCRLLAS